MLGSSTEVDQIVAVLLDYLVRHPAAADTVEGIAKWWIPAQRFEVLLPRVELALDLLVKQGALRLNVLADGRCVYASAAKASG